MQCNATTQGREKICLLALMIRVSIGLIRGNGIMACKWKYVIAIVRLRLCFATNDCMLQSAHPLHCIQSTISSIHLSNLLHFWMWYYVWRYFMILTLHVVPCMHMWIYVNVHWIALILIYACEREMGIYCKIVVLGIC